MRPRTAALAPTETPALLEFLFRLAQAYLACGEQTAELERIVRDVALAYGMRGARVVTFPTAVFISLDDGEGERVTLSEGPAQALRLDQIAEVYVLGDAAQRGEVTPREGLERLAAILRTPARFGPVGSVAGHTILTVGLAMVLRPSLDNLAAAAALGAVIGVLKELNRGRTMLAVPLPVLAAALVSALVLYAEKRGLAVNALSAVVPPLVTFLPGAMLALSMKELAYGDMVSGSSRLITGFVQLVLLAFGLVAGATLVGEPSTYLLEPTTQVTGAPWATAAGVVVFGIGLYLHLSAPPRSLGWMLFVMFVALAAQRLGAGLFGSMISGFFGTLVATPLAYLIQLRFRGPPATVTFLPSFWLLVPGSLGLESVASMLGNRAAGLEGLTTVVFAMASIALGTLVGASSYKWLSEKARRLQRRIRRVRSYVRRSGTG
jgi:uncharacterized membrane protein YjjP (DUF1212 family)